MSFRFARAIPQGMVFIAAIFSFVLAPIASTAAPYAALVMDARNGEVLHAENADTRLHPASLTKMMTLYIAFQAIERGEIGIDDQVTVTSLAASEPPSKLGLRTGQKIALRYLLRAAAIKSANDAATAIGVAISGSEAAFADRMNRTAAAMGMRSTSFMNAHGLTQQGHLSTARDMSVLGRHVIYDFPQYYNLFSRRSADAGIATVHHTNRRWLNSYRGGDGIKTGFTNAAGYNLVASAQRGQERIIATVFGGRSTTTRNARITELMDLGFNRAPTRVALRRPTPPNAMVAYADPPASEGVIRRNNGLVNVSMRPTGRPQAGPSEAELLLAAVDDSIIDSVVASAMAADVAEAASVPVRPRARPAISGTVMAALTEAEPEAEVQEVVTRLSTSGGRHWGVNVGRFDSRHEAERHLLQVALNEMSTLDGSVRRVVQRQGGFDANFMGLSRETADLACRRLNAKGTSCFMLGDES